MKSRHSLKDYFTFSRKERLAVLVLVLVTGTLFLLPSFLPRAGREQFTAADSSWIREMTSLVKRPDDSVRLPRKKPAYFSPENSPPPAVYFPFDPNTASGADWTRLGLREKTIRTILRFREKGGVFRRPEDLGRIYGLQPDEFRRLQPWIQIKATGKPARLTRDTVFFTPPSSPPAYRKKDYRILDINEADSSHFVLLPGIGPRLAARIVAFREKLGGFYSPEQIAETWGLPDSVFRRIRPYLKTGSTGHRKWNINTVTESELKGHPYFRWQVIRPLLAYRAEHGPFRGVEDIRKVQALSDSVCRKITPYLMTE